MTIVVGWLKQIKHKSEYWDQPTIELHGTAIADSMLSFRNEHGTRASMHKEIKKIIPLTLQFGIPNCGLGRIRYFSKYQCHGIGLSIAGSHILSSLIVNEIRELCSNGLVLSIDSDAIVTTSDKRAAAKFHEADDFAFNEYPLLNLDELAEHIRKIIHTQTAYYCAEHISEQSFTNKSCQISMFGMCPEDKILKMFEFISKLDRINGVLSIDLIKHTDEAIFIHGSANDEVKGEITAMFESIDGETVTEAMLRTFIEEKIASGDWEDQGIGGKATIATIGSLMYKDVRIFETQEPEW